jgi:hypothetical protein
LTRYTVRRILHPLGFARHELTINFPSVSSLPLYPTGLSFAFPLLLLLAGDLPMSRVKFNARQEYEYLSNFKVLQNAFKSKKIDKVSSALYRFLESASSLNPSQS